MARGTRTVETVADMNIGSFYRGKRVLVTGHTGFKGTWLCRLLLHFGAEVTGYALAPPTTPSLFDLTDTARDMHSVRGDVRDAEHLAAVVDGVHPEIVFHLAAQPLVSEGYRSPCDTYATNVMGTVYLLEAVRRSRTVRSVVVVTTDKVYENKEWHWGYRENEPLGGFDPYAGSKACAELVTATYRSSFLAARGVALSTARAGNVIGGGDYAARIVPDLLRAALAGQAATVRNPHSVRPYQHVLEPLCAYLLLAKEQYENTALAGAYNIGPDEVDCRTTGEVADLFASLWGEGFSWHTGGENGLHESGLLKLDSSKFKAALGWHPTWHIEDALMRVVRFARALTSGESVADVTDTQIKEFLENFLSDH